MEPQVFELLVARFDQLEKTLDDLNTTIKEHVELDSQYWKKIDQQEAQWGLVKYVVGAAGALGGALSWLLSRFQSH